MGTPIKPAFGGEAGAASSPTTTKGDLIVRGASADERLAVGADGQVPVADAASPTGIKWDTPAAGGAAAAMEGVRLEKNVLQASTTGEVAVIWQTEVFDDNGFADLGANNTRITVPAGVTRVSLVAGLDTASTSFTTLAMSITKNGGGIPGVAFIQSSAAFSGSKGVIVSTGILDVVPGDYFEVKINFSTSTNLDPTPGTFFSMVNMQGTAGATGATGAGSTTFEDLPVDTGYAMLGEIAQLNGQRTDVNIGADFVYFDFIFFDGLTTINQIACSAATAPTAGALTVGLHPVTSRLSIGDQSFVDDITTTAVGNTRFTQTVNWTPTKGWYAIAISSASTGLNNIVGVFASTQSGGAKFFPAFAYSTPGDQEKENMTMALKKSDYPTTPDLSGIDFNDITIYDSVSENELTQGTFVPIIEFRAA